MKRAADESRALSRTVRVGTVTAATVPLLAPTIHAFRDTHPSTVVEILTGQQTGIHRALLEGSMDLGLVNYLEGDDMPPEFESTELLRGHPGGLPASPTTSWPPRRPSAAPTSGGGR